MNLLYVNPLALVFHYLGLFFYGTPLDVLHSQFSEGDKRFADVDPASQPRRSTRTGNSDHQIYDFIVVGGGSAGSTLSARLTEDGKYSVLLLEAGGNPFPLTSVPAMAIGMLANKNIDWTDKTVPQDYACHALKNNGSFYNRGKSLGGGSVLNYMVYQRGSYKDYDDWSTEVNDSQWNFENVLPYFRKLETYNGEFLNETYHGTDGPLHIDSISYAPLREEWLSAGLELGYKISDPNGYQEESFFPFETTTNVGTRCTTHQAYLLPAIGRKNLKVLIYSHVTKIQFNSEMRAVGVKYMHGGRQHSAQARNEVILSAGSLGSPQILFLSGIGPKDHLEDFGITCRVDLPVGQGLQDHVISYLGPFTYDKNKSSTSNLDSEFNENTLHEYLTRGTGRFSGLGIAGGALTLSSVAKPDHPDLYYTLLDLQLTKEAGELIEHAYDFKPGFLSKYFSKDLGKDAFLILVALGKPKATGEVKLTSSSPFSRLSIDPKYLTHEEDAQAMLEGSRLALKIVKETEAMKKINAKLIDSMIPGCEAFPDTSSDEYLKCFIKFWTLTMWHYTSTCKMGVGPETSVVDSNLRVHKTEGLRVVDLSAMPKVPTTNTNLPTIMIAEKAADMIKAFWDKQPPK